MQLLNQSSGAGFIFHQALQVLNADDHAIPVTAAKAVCPHQVQHLLIQLLDDPVGICALFYGVNRVFFRGFGPCSVYWHTLSLKIRAPLISIYKKISILIASGGIDLYKISMKNMTAKHILLLPGDGIGPEVVRETEKVIRWYSENGPVKFTTSSALIGGSAYDAVGTPFPDDTLAQAKKADAILLGAVGGPKWESLEYSKRPERGLLGLRKELGLFANLRPAICFEALADASTLRREVVTGLDVMIVRELTGGIYFGSPRGVETLPDGTRRGFNTEVYTSPEVERIAHVAFELAAKRAGRVCSVDKANVLECTEMWREEVTKVHKKSYPKMELSHMYVDNAAMQLVRNPKQFDVMVTTNMFGDILSDIASMLTGSLGMLPSASLGAPGAPGVYEPVHGSAPDIAGKGVANPIATILSFAMMLKYSFDMVDEGHHIQDAVIKVLEQGYRTADIMQPGMKKVSTSEMGDAIIQALDALQSAYTPGISRQSRPG
jgi:3-isopropylmalate dehydrogenase